MSAALSELRPSNFTTAFRAAAEKTVLWGAITGSAVALRAFTSMKFFAVCGGAVQIGSGLILSVIASELTSYTLEKIPDHAFENTCLRTLLVTAKYVFPILAGAATAYGVISIGMTLNLPLSVTYIAYTGALSLITTISHRTPSSKFYHTYATLGGGA